MKKINKIYEVVANKELSFGCRYKIINRDKRLIFKIRSEHEIECIKNLEGLKIIGHPVLIGDMLDYMKDYDFPESNINYPSTSQSENFILSLENLWEFKRKPIEEQSQECIKYIYNLIEDEK